MLVPRRGTVPKDDDAVVALPVVGCRLDSTVPYTPEYHIARDGRRSIQNKERTL